MERFPRFGGFNVTNEKNHKNLEKFSKISLTEGKKYNILSIPKREGHLKECEMIENLDISIIHPRGRRVIME